MPADGMSATAEKGLRHIPVAALLSGYLIEHQCVRGVTTRLCREAQRRERGAVIATIRSQVGSQRSDLVYKAFSRDQDPKATSMIVAG
jgi:hypothetical protein